jgi:hypothetical protein
MITTFEQQGFYVERNAISRESAEILAAEFNIVRDYTYFVNKVDPSDLTRYGDNQSPKSFSYYSPTCFESLMITMLPKIEEITNKKLYPSYSYGRIYYNGAELLNHKDRRSCEYSVTMTIDMDHVPWDINFIDRKNKINAISLNIGDMCVYKGDELSHWREPYHGDRQLQAFLHYVEVHGKFSHYKYDTRPALGLPNSYRNFGYDLIN